MDFNNKVVIVTGAGSGIGAATSKQFAQLGAEVIISDINEQGVETIHNEIKESGGRSTVFIADVSNFDAVNNLINQTVSLFGRIDIMVNNAGIANRTPAKTAEHPLDEWDEVIRVNQTGVFYCMKLALKQMMSQRGGNIVNVASLAGLKASAKNLAYSASKFAVVGMTKSAAMEYASQNIRINAVCPGYTRSGMFDKIIEGKPELSNKLLSYIPMARFGQPNEIADTILWLASEQTSFITGQAITLDGGLSI